MDYISKIEGHPIKAECLKESPRLLDSTPYLFRPSFSNGYGYETLIGGTCGVNQLIQNGNFESVANWLAYQASYSISNNECLATVTSGNLSGDIYQDITTTEGHKYLYSVDCKNDTSSELYIGFNNTSETVHRQVTASAYTNVSGIVTSASGSTFIRFYLTVVGDSKTSNMKNVNIVDLTTMFGTTIADYVYTLESGTSGAGITWLKNNGFFGADYYPYNSGALLSVKTSKKINTGKNFTDISDNTIAGAGYVIGGFPVAINSDNSIFPSGNYVFSFDVQNATYPCAYQLIWYRNGVEVGNTVATINASGINAIAFTASGKFDSIVMFCNSSSGGAFTNFNLNIGSIPLAYEPYVKHEYPLDDIELRGILKLDGNNNLYYDGDIYESNGSVTRKYGIVDLGSFTYNKNSTNIADRYRFTSQTQLSNAKAPATNNTPPNAFVGIYQPNGRDSAWANDIDKVFSFDNGYVNIYDSAYNGSTPEAAKTALDGVYLVYELSTISTETADTFTNPMIVDGNGTEEFVDGRTVEMPVGHSTIYVDNSDKTKLDNLPDISDSGDGTYVIKQENGKQSLVTPNATDISYSNTSSGLTATKVQGAIDEVNTKVGTKANSSDVYTKSNTYNKTEVNSILTPVKTANGNPCTFTTDLADALVSLTADVVCGQDLHGYDHPWPSGGGKNKLEVTAQSQTINGITFTVNSDGTITANGTATAESTLVLVNGTGIFDFTTEMVLNGSVGGFGSSVRTRFGVSGVGSYDDFGNGVTIPIISDISTRYSYVQITIASGTTVNNVTFKPMISTTGGDFEPYSNICPLVGHSELNLTRCGKNLFDKTTTIDDNWINSSGSAVYFPGGFYSALIPVKPDTTYYLSNVIGGNDFVSSVHYDSDMNVIGAKNVSGSSIQSGSITTFNNSAYMRINSNTANKDTVMVSEGSTPSEYEPYNGQTFTVAFGQTVYGGVYDKSGRLTIDTVKVVLNGTQPIGLANWNPNTNTRAWIYLLTTFPDIKDYEIKDSNISSCKLKADKLKTVTYHETDGISTNDIPSISIVGGDYWSIVVRVNDTTLENDTAINNYLSQNPIEVCYELATPIVIDVPSISVFAENGTNNIVSDCGGDIAVKYADGDLADQIIQIIKAYIKEETNNET